MVDIQLVGVGCSKSWKMEDKLIKLSRELGIPVQIVKVMDLDKIIELGLSTIPVLVHAEKVWNYDVVMQGGKLKQILIELNNLQRKS